MPVVDQQANAPKHKRVIAVSAAVVVVLAFIGGVLWWSAVNNADKQDQARFDRTMKLSQSEIGFSKYNEAIKLLTDYIPTARTEQRRTQAEVQVGDAYYSKIDYTNAMKWYRKAESDGSASDLPVIIRIARVADAAGDKTTAVSYYQKALQQKGLDDLDKQDINMRLAVLGAK